MIIYLDFYYVLPIIGNLYNNDNHIARIEYNDMNNSKTGKIFINKREHFKNVRMMTVDLDEEFYDFYMRNKYNTDLKDFDLRIIWFMNRLEGDQPYYFKAQRQTMYIFSKNRICSYYNTPLSDRRVTYSCTNDAIVKGNDNRFYCLAHIPK